MHPTTARILAPASREDHDDDSTGLGVSRTDLEGTQTVFGTTTKGCASVEPQTSHFGRLVVFIQPHFAHLNRAAIAELSPYALHRNLE